MKIIKPLRDVAVAADVELVGPTTQAVIQEWNITAVVDRKDGTVKRDSEWQGFMATGKVSKGDDKAKSICLPINAALFRKLEEDMAEEGNDVQFFEVKEKKGKNDVIESYYTLINFTFGIENGKLIC